jgi:hypothetical protein
LFIDQVGSPALRLVVLFQVPFSSQMPVEGSQGDQSSNEEGRDSISVSACLSIFPSCRISIQGSSPQCRRMNLESHDYMVGMTRTLSFGRHLCRGIDLRSVRQQKQMTQIRTERTAISLGIPPTPIFIMILAEAPSNHLMVRTEGVESHDKILLDTFQTFQCEQSFEEHLSRGGFDKTSHGP